jgi:hypothetical protein
MAADDTFGMGLSKTGRIVLTGLTALQGALALFAALGGFWGQAVIPLLLFVFGIWILRRNARLQSQKRSAADEDLPAQGEDEQA